jgi:hypothetical protein
MMCSTAKLYGSIFMIIELFYLTATIFKLFLLDDKLMISFIHFIIRVSIFYTPHSNFHFEVVFTSRLVNKTFLAYV